MATHVRPPAGDQLIHIDGVPSSAELASKLAGNTHLLAFSGGKDSIAAALYALNEGIDFVPYHCQVVPGLKFVEDYLDYCEEWMGRHIVRIPHPAFWKTLRNGVFQTPFIGGDLEMSDLPDYDWDTVRRVVALDYNLTNPMTIDGVRAADSIVRRASIRTHGPWKKNGKVSLIWDWRVAPLREYIAAHGVRLPPDYEWFGRSFDGIDGRFVAPLKEHSPADYERIREFYPLIDLEVLRHEANA